MGNYNIETFMLDGFPNSVKVTLDPNITKKELLGFPAFEIWRNTLKNNLALQSDKSHAFYRDPYSLRSILIQSVDRVGSRISSVKLNAEILNSAGTRLPGITVLRGGSVAILMIFRPKGSRNGKLVMMTEQPRVPAGSLGFREIPAGTFDDAGIFSGAATKEIFEVTGIKIKSSGLQDLTALALGDLRIPDNQTLQKAMYTSPGGSDEFMPILLWERELEGQHIEYLRSKLTEQRRRGGMTTLRLCYFEDLWREGARDAKSLAAWALYEGLTRENMLQRNWTSDYRVRLY